MSLPTVITDLSTTAASNSPAGSDPIGTSLDDYLRIIQVFVKQLFNTGVIYCDTVGGTGDVITLTPTPALTAYKAGQGLMWLASGANTTNVTANASGLGAKAVTKSGATALVAGDIPASSVLIIAVYDGTQLQITNLISTSSFTSLKITTSINDASNNELLKFSSTASAVNEISIINNSTGLEPRIEVTGNDTNIGLNIRAKGTGVINLLGTNTAQAEYRMFEQTGNGSNYIGFKPPAAVTANCTFTLPDGDGSAGQVIKTDGSKNLSFTTLSSVVSQIAPATATATATGTTAMPYDNTIPQNTEGDQYLSKAITPTSSTDILEFDGSAMFGEDANNDYPLSVALFQDSNANAIFAAGFISNTTSIAQGPYPVAFTYRMTAGTTSSTTFNLRAGFNTSSTCRINGSNGGRIFGGVAAAFLIIKQCSQ